MLVAHTVFVAAAMNISIMSSVVEGATSMRSQTAYHQKLHFYTWEVMKFGK
ncbi:hypothetical protein HOLleu_17383 [Holothuria leucospilota]|uniref:Uncharacterized protein n=1 Tax=Holothuria leucospilota TaxID=206669 RepID=A0A9Q1C269_HOLLE|nr:hypothetical protein HOLleu_17383 [Holothuria leucospilota]